jgi:hypothetical protein
MSIASATPPRLQRAESGSERNADESRALGEDRCDEGFGLWDVGDELEEAAVWVAKVDAHASPLGAVSRDRSVFDLDVVRLGAGRGTPRSWLRDRRDQPSRLRGASVRRRARARARKDRARARSAGVDWCLRRTRTGSSRPRCTTTLITTKPIAVAVIAASTAIYAATVLIAFWQPNTSAIAAIALAFAVIALEYGGLGLPIGVTVRGDVEGFFLIIMGSLVDTFLQNPLQNPLANKPVLQYFPSFGPMQFATGGSFGHPGLYGDLAIGLAWAATFTAIALFLFTLRTRPARRTPTRAGRDLPQHPEQHPAHA